MMKRARPRKALGLLGPGLIVAAGCTGSYGSLGTTSFLVVNIVPDATGDTHAGTADKPLPLTFDRSAPITIAIEAHRIDGQLDPTFNGYVRVSIKPGTVVGLSGSPDVIDGRNVLLRNGKADGIGVAVAGAFGASHIWVEDIGYTPVDPSRKPPPQCSNGKDDNGNAKIDFPADPGCAFANDDNEDLGTYASGATSTVWFTTPRVADVRGVAQGGAATSFPHQQVNIDTGWHPHADDPNHFDFSVIVTRIASDGFYVTDINDPRGFGSVFAYNFSTPPEMRVCDRLKSLGGTSSDFYGFTELGFPTWELELWDPFKRPCLIPEAHVFKAPEIARDATTGTYMNPQLLTAQIAALVRLQNDPSQKVDVHVSKHFGPNFPKKETNYAPEENATNCDLNQDGKVDFNTDPEKTCAANCSVDVECSEYSQFLRQNAFSLVVSAPDVNTGFPLTGSILADGSSAADFDPVTLRGQPIHSFTGTLRYFSGGTQYTIEARCADDIVVDMNATPLGSDRACVHARTESDNSSASN
jgi:hypothetical protein